MLMEKATPERSLCMSSFQSKCSQSCCDPKAGQQHTKAEPIPQRQLKKMGKDISASNSVWSKLQKPVLAIHSSTLCHGC